MPHIDDLLRIAVERKASDLHLKVGNFPHVRVDGDLVPVTDQARITAEDMLNMAFSMMSAAEIRHRPVGAPSTTVGVEDVTKEWLPAAGPVVIGLTAGASTPNNIVGEVIRKLEQFCSA